MSRYYDPPTPPVRSIFGLFFALALLLAAAGLAQVAGWGHFSDDLYRVHIDSEGSVSYAEIGTLPDNLGPIALGPNGLLYATTSASEPDLYSIDPATGNATLLGPLFPGAMPLGSTDLAFDQNGILWYLTDESLYQLDPASGGATFVTSGLTGLILLASRDGDLYGLVADFLGDITITFAQVDPLGGIDLLGELPDLGLDGAFITFPESLDFDNQGGIWLHAWYSTGIIDPPLIEPRFLYYADPESGQPGEFAENYDQLFEAFTLGPSPAGSIAEVPVLSFLGSLLLALGLGVVGWRRHRSA